MKKTTNEQPQPQQPAPKVLVATSNVVHVDKLTQAGLPPIGDKLAGVNDMAKNMQDANARMNERIEATKLPNNLGI